jgi:hypothetical protein
VIVTAVVALLSLAGATQLRARVGAAPRTYRSSARAMAAGPKSFGSVEKVEAELRVYVGALPADALGDESLRPPLGYAELSRNGRDDLAKAARDGRLHPRQQGARPPLGVGEGPGAHAVCRDRQL